MVINCFHTKVIEKVGKDYIKKWIKKLTESGVINSSAVIPSRRIDPDLSTASSGISLTVTLTVASTLCLGIKSDSS